MSAAVVMTPDEMRKRTQQFALRIVRLYQALPKNGEACVLGRQLLRSGTSVGANYRAVCSARSEAEFVAKMCIVLEEADETVYWLELLMEVGVVEPGRIDDLLREAGELTKIFGAARRTAKGRGAAPIANNE